MNDIKLHYKFVLFNKLIKLDKYITAIYVTRIYLRTYYTGI